jgi:hypothetical protein
MFVSQTFSTFSVALHRAIPQAGALGRPLFIVPGSDEECILRDTAPAFGVEHFRVDCSSVGSWQCFRVARGVFRDTLVRHKFASGVDETLLNAASKRFLNSETMWGVR